MVNNHPYWEDDNIAPLRKFLGDASHPSPMVDAYAARYMLGWPVDLPARWAATSNVAGGSGTEEEAQGP